MLYTRIRASLLLSSVSTLLSSNAINFISEFHRLLSLTEPRHPLVSVINLAESIFLEDEVWKGFVNRFYCVSLVESLLKYSNRFYERQFQTRKNNNTALLTRFEQLIDDYSNSEVQGLLTVPIISSLFL